MPVFDKMLANVSPRAFSLVRDMEFERIHELSNDEIRPMLPSFIRMVLCHSIDMGEEWRTKKMHILRKLQEIESANSIVALLSADFVTLDVDVKKELVVRSKMGALPGDSVLISSLNEGLALEFERADGVRKLRLLLSELFAIQSLTKVYTVPDMQAPGPSTSMGSGNFTTHVTPRSSELFDNDLYFDDIADALCIAASELPNSIVLVDIVETLLCVHNGSRYICRMVANQPEMFNEVCMSLINNGEKQDEETFGGRMRREALRALCRMNRDATLLVRTIAVENMRMPGLAILLTLDYDQSCLKINPDHRSDLVPFLTGILLGYDDKTRTWFAQYIRLGQKKIEQVQHTTVTEMRSELLKILNALIANKALEQDESSDYDLVQACSLLRLYCALRAAAAMKFTEEESAAILSLLTTNPPVTVTGIKLVTISLCMILSCSNLMQGVEAEKRALQWLHRLSREERYYGVNCKVQSSLGEMLLLVAIHFHSNQQNAIQELVCATLGMKIPIRANNLSRMRIVFTQEVFAEEAIATHAVKVPVTNNLNAHVGGFLPNHCIYHLLKNRAFTKHKVPIREWILKQIKQASAPLHPILPPLIETYINSIIVPHTKQTSSIVQPASFVFTNEPLSEADLISIFKYQIFAHDDTLMDTDEDRPQCLLTSQLLLLMYVLLYDDVRLSHTRVTTKPKKYSADVMSKIPIFYLVQAARRDLLNYGSIFPILLRLISTHHSHLCLVQDWLDSRSIELPMQGTPTKISFETGKKLLHDAFDRLDKDPSRFVRAIDYLSRQPTSSLWPLASTFINLLPKMLDSKSAPKQAFERVGKLWWRLNTIFPDNLWLMTVNAFRVKHLYIVRTETLSWDDIVSDPLYVLRCDERVFRCAEFMKITLHILSAFLAASRTYLAHHLHEKPSKTLEDEKGREELKDALIRAQESAAVQILLECCLPESNDEVENADMRRRLDEVQSIVCTYLHQMFILDTMLAKLVHFQTYDNQLLKLTVSSVPSMHICLEFIPELLSQPDLMKQVFAIELCSHLCKQYSTTKFLSIAKLCINVSITLISVLSGAKRTKFFIPVLPALGRMCEAFPPLRSDGKILLKQLEQICISKLAATNPTFVSANAARKKFNPVRLSNLSNSDYKQFVESLDVDDVLFLKVQEALADLEKQERQGIKRIRTE